MTTTPETEQRSIEAKEILERINKFAQLEDGTIDIIRKTVIIGGLVTETLMEYEEPDNVMEQAFHRIAELMGIQPTDGQLQENQMPYPYHIDQDIEIGRKLARMSGEKLPKQLDDVHEIAIALILSELPLMAPRGLSIPDAFRLLIESVIYGLTFEMAAQDFCDLMVEEYIADGWPVSRAIEALSAVSGVYLKRACKDNDALMVQHIEEVLKVTALESMRLGMEGRKSWWLTGPANDVAGDDLKAFVEEFIDDPEEFFEIIGLESDLAKAVSVAKATGRIIAASTNEDVGQMQPHVAKSLAKAGLVAGTKLTLTGM